MVVLAMPADSSPAEVAVNAGLIQLATAVASIAIDVPQRSCNTCGQEMVIMNRVSSYSKRCHLVLHISAHPCSPGLMVQWVVCWGALWP